MAIWKFRGWRRSTQQRQPLVIHGEFEREDDGRWLADIPELPGVLAYGATQDEAVKKALGLAFRVIGDRLERGEMDPHHSGFSVDVSLLPA